MSILNEGGGGGVEVGGNITVASASLSVSGTVVLSRFSVRTPKARTSTHRAVTKVSVVADTIAGIILSVLQSESGNQRYH